MSWLKSMPQTDCKIKYYFQQLPIPVIEHFKFVLSQASGEYFMFLADDDWIDANYIEECFFFFKTILIILLHVANVLIMNSWGTDK